VLGTRHQVGHPLVFTMRKIQATSTTLKGSGYCTLPNVAPSIRRDDGLGQLAQESIADESM
jgi:hypothetical protein